ncbi:hypothetical protein M378DRAFT_656843 [Amanita muscaria Koide BX008]|uniref:Uncharacterized protein n=1 Tax=Amanita muscaria (strain Koide BX008) TaxID=946122 RepID=A0A0C2X4U3_AMAMK|nr:hypothetical protein M378DRAFT_656843 [Amanita muscaria Koide BX008]
MSPFALLDELYLEILRQQRDQEFLKTFLALLVGRTSIKELHLHKDDTTLMNVSVKELHIKLRRMRALLKFEPFIDVYHKSFLDFLQDLSRSGQYHVSKQGGLKRYLELIVDSVIRHISMAIEQPNCHEACHLSPQFTFVVNTYPSNIVLPVEDWQEALKPLLHLQDKLLNTPKLRPCHITQVMRDLQLHLVILQGGRNAAAQVPDSNMNESVTKQSLTLVTEAGQNTPEEDLDRCFSGLLSCLLKTDSVTAARVRSITNAQRLIDLIDLVNR